MKFVDKFRNCIKRMYKYDYERAEKHPIRTFISDLFVYTLIVIFSCLIVTINCLYPNKKTEAKADTISYTETYEYTVTGKLQGIRLYQNTTVSGSSYAEIISDIVIKYSSKGITSVSRATYNTTTGQITYIDVPVTQTGEFTQNVTALAKVYTTSTVFSVASIPLTLDCANGANTGNFVVTQFYSEQTYQPGAPVYGVYTNTANDRRIAQMYFRYPDSTSIYGYSPKQGFDVYIQDQTYMPYKYFQNKTPQEITIQFGELPAQGYDQGRAEGYEQGYKDGKEWQYGQDAATIDGAYERGRQAGIEQAQSNNLRTLVFAVVDAQINGFTQFFNFELLGYNLLNVITAVFTLGIALWVIKLIF